MRKTILIALLPAAFFLSGCALFGIESGYRSLTIQNHQFEPARIEVPAGTPFVLTINALDDRDLPITAPSLGIDFLRVPATPVDRRPIATNRPNPARYARLPLGPLKAGEYPISCECHGHASTAVVVAKPSR